MRNINGGRGKPKSKTLLAPSISEEGYTIQILKRTAVIRQCFVLGMCVYRGPHLTKQKENLCPPLPSRSYMMLKGEKEEKGEEEEEKRVEDNDKEEEEEVEVLAERQSSKVETSGCCRAVPPPLKLFWHRGHGSTPSSVSSGLERSLGYTVSLIPRGRQKLLRKGRRHPPYPTEVMHDRRKTAQTSGVP